MDFCRLCQQDRPLRDSHIIPRFVSRWLLETSPTRGLRDLTTPNRRRQDAPTMPFLCWDCEQVFSPWEGKFAELLFLPLHRNESDSFTYGTWGLKFASSVMWRVLVESLERGRGRLTPEQARLAGVAAQTWRAFLLGKVRHPGRFEVHAIPLTLCHRTLALTCRRSSAGTSFVQPTQKLSLGTRRSWFTPSCVASCS